MQVILFLTTYFVLINLIGFLSMGLDKKKSKKHLWRIPEATLFIIALIGGSIGSLIGMYTFCHKTRHWYFVYGIPAILIIQIAMIVILFFLPIEFSIL